MSFFDELKRRNVFKVGIAYAITAWLLIQVADILLETIGAPPWIMQTLFVVLGIGVVIALFFAWAFELTPEGVKRESEVDRSQSITPQTGQKLNRTIIAILVMALGYFVVDKFYLSAPRPEKSVVEPSATKEAEESTSETIAVLPFVDMSQDGNNEYFSDGLTEELLNILAKIKELRVAGRTSSFAFKGKNEDLRSIGEKLNVTSILEGSVRKDEKSNKVRVTAQLINVEDGYHLWSETYDRDLNDIFAIQEEIARKVAGALRVTLLGEDEARIEAQAVTDISAYDLYLRGLQQLNTYSFDSLRQAVETFGQALEQDPNYEPAKLHLAMAWLDLAFTGAISQAEGSGQARPLLDQVLEEDPSNSLAHVLMARLMRNIDPALQRRELELALDSDPRNVTALKEMGRMVLFVDSHVDKAFEYIKEAERIEPYSVDVLWDLIAFNTFTGQAEKTLPYAERIGELQPDNPNRYWGPGMGFLINGQLATSLDYQLKAAKTDPKDYELMAGIASVWLALGDLEQAEHWMKLSDETGADQPYPTAIRVNLYKYREQYGLAADMAKRALDRKVDNRMGSNGILRRAYISNLFRQGDIQQAIDYFKAEIPGAFTTPIDLSGIPARRNNVLVEIALLLEQQQPGSERAVELINSAEQRALSKDPRFIPWQRALERATIAAARKDKKTATEEIRKAVESGMRNGWHDLLYTNIAFNDLHDEPEFKELVAMIEKDMEQQREEAYQLPGALR